MLVCVLSGNRHRWVIGLRVPAADWVREGGHMIQVTTRRPRGTHTLIIIVFFMGHIQWSSPPHVLHQLTCKTPNLLLCIKGLKIDIVLSLCCVSNFSNEWKKIKILTFFFSRSYRMTSGTTHPFINCVKGLTVYSIQRLTACPAQNRWLIFFVSCDIRTLLKQKSERNLVYLKMESAIVFQYIQSLCFQLRKEQVESVNVGGTNNVINGKTTCYIIPHTVWYTIL